MEKTDPPSSYSPPPYTYPQPPESMPSPPQSVLITSAVPFSKENQQLICPHCHANITTRVESEANMKTHIVALLLCLVGCCCIAPFPYCMDSCLIHKHFCPECNCFLGASKN